MTVRPISLALLLLAFPMGGCGDGGAETTVPVDTNPVASTPDATAPPADATQPGTGPVTTETAPPAPPATTEPDAGDEQAVRVPATFAIRGGALRPRTITVPPFLAVEISVRSDDGRAHRLVLRTPQPETLAVGAGERVVRRLAGLRAGRYAIELDGRAAGSLVAGGEVGP